MTTINNQDDFLRALSENPQWRELVRAQILGDELLQLPARFDALSARLDACIEELRESNREQKEINRELREIARRHDDAIAEIRAENQEAERRHQAAMDEAEQRHQAAMEEAEQRHQAAKDEAEQRLQAFVEEMREMGRQIRASMDEAERRHQAFVEEMRESKRRFEAFMEEMQQFRREQQIINQDIRNLHDDLTRHVRLLTDDVGKIKGHFAREVVLDDAPGLALDMGLEYVRFLTRDELREMAQRAAGGSIPVNQLRSFRRADLVIEAKDGDDRHYIVVEISFTADEREPTRAIRHAELLTEFTNCPAHAAIASVRNVQSVSDRIDAGEIHWHPIDETDLEPD